MSGQQSSVYDEMYHKNIDRERRSSHESCDDINISPIKAIVQPWKSFKLLVDPQLHRASSLGGSGSGESSGGMGSGVGSRVIRYDGKIVPGQPHYISPPFSADPRNRQLLWRRLEQADLPLPRLKLDENYVGEPPKVEVTFENLNDNIDNTFLSRMIEKFGGHEEMVIYHHPVNRRHLGLARVLFSETTSARECVSHLNGKSVMGLQIKVYLDSLSAKCKALFNDLTAERSSTNKMINEELTTSGKSRWGSTDQILNANIGNHKTFQPTSTTQKINESKRILSIREDHSKNAVQLQNRESGQRPTQCGKVEIYSSSDENGTNSYTTDKRLQYNKNSMQHTRNKDEEKTSELYNNVSDVSSNSYNLALRESSKRKEGHHLSPPPHKDSFPSSGRHHSTGFFPSSENKAENVDEGSPLLHKHLEALNSLSIDGDMAILKNRGDVPNHQSNFFIHSDRCSKDYNTTTSPISDDDMDYNNSHNNQNSSIHLLSKSKILSSNKKEKEILGNDENPNPLKTLMNSDEKVIENQALGVEFDGSSANRMASFGKGAANSASIDLDTRLQQLMNSGGALMPSFLFLNDEDDANVVKKEGSVNSEEGGEGGEGEMELEEDDDKMSLDSLSDSNINRDEAKNSFSTVQNRDRDNSKLSLYPLNPPNPHVNPQHDEYMIREMRRIKRWDKYQNEILENRTKPTFKSVMQKCVDCLVNELKVTLRKDVNKKFCESLAFASFDKWWKEREDEVANKTPVGIKNDKPTLDKHSVNSKSTTSAWNQKSISDGGSNSQNSDHHRGKVEYHQLQSVFDAQRLKFTESSEGLGGLPSDRQSSGLHGGSDVNSSSIVNNNERAFGLGGSLGLGFRATIPKLPSFKIKKQDSSLKKDGGLTREKRSSNTTKLKTMGHEREESIDRNELKKRKEKIEMKAKEDLKCNGDKTTSSKSNEHHKRDEGKKKKRKEGGEVEGVDSISSAVAGKCTIESVYNALYNDDSSDEKDHILKRIPSPLQKEEPKDKDILKDESDNDDDKISLPTDWDDNSSAISFSAKSVSSNSSSDSEGNENSRKNIKNLQRKKIKKKNDFTNKNNKSSSRRRRSKGRKNQVIKKKSGGGDFFSTESNEISSSDVQSSDTSEEGEEEESSDKDNANTRDKDSILSSLSSSSSSEESSDISSSSNSDSESSKAGREIKISNLSEIKSNSLKDSHSVDDQTSLCSVVLQRLSSDEISSSKNGGSTASESEQTSVESSSLSHGGSGRSSVVNTYEDHCYAVVAPKQSTDIETQPQEGVYEVNNDHGGYAVKSSVATASSTVVNKKCPSSSVDRRPDDLNVDRERRRRSNSTDSDKSGSASSTSSQDDDDSDLENSFSPHKMKKGIKGKNDSKGGNVDILDRSKSLGMLNMAVFTARDHKQQFEVVYKFLTKGLDLEDIRYLRRAYEMMLAKANDNPDTLGWLTDTHWVDHPVTEVFEDIIDSKKKKKSNDKMKEGGKRVGGKSKIKVWKSQDGVELNDDFSRPHLTGSARTEGYYKMDVREKAATKFHLHRSDVDIDAILKSGKSGQLTAHSLSREARSNQRRQMAVFGDEALNSDLLKFNQLMFRRKLMTFGKSSIHDWGLFSLEDIGADEMVIEYVGHQVRTILSDVREQNYEKMGIGSSYLFRIDNDHVVDATKAGNLARFINHSCDPNCYAKVITVDSEKKIVIYSKQSIGAGEEITYDYKFPIEDEKIRCLCQSKNCRKYLN